MIQRDQNELTMQLCKELQLTLLGARSLFAHALTEESFRRVELNAQYCRETVTIRKENCDNQVKTLVPGQHHLTRIVNMQECSTFIELDNNRDEVSGTKSSQSERFKSGLQGSIG